MSTLHMPDIWQIMLSIKSKVMRKAMQNSENTKKEEEEEEKRKERKQKTLFYHHKKLLKSSQDIPFNSF